MRLSPNDQLQIFNQIAAADNLATARNVTAYALLFATNGSITGAKGSVSGRDVIESFTQKTWDAEPVNSVHLMTSPQIVSMEGAVAHAQSTLLIVDAANRNIIDVRIVEHQLVQVNQQWLFLNRTVK